MKIDNSELKGKTATNFIWRFAERCGAQLVAFSVSVVLARILTPSDYGTLALISVFITILQVFVDSGLGTALIQKEHIDNTDFSTVFYTNILFCILLYGLFFILSPHIANFYDRGELVPYLRVLSITILISGVKNVQQAYVSRNLLFKKFFFSTLGGTFIAAVVGISMAYCGCGVWALIAQQLVNLTIDTTILWITVKWRPTKVFSINRLKELFSYGWKLLISGLMDVSYNELRQLIIGKMYSSSDLAFYNQGRKFPNLIVTNVNTSVDSVLLPVMSRAQNEKEKVKTMTRRAIKTSTYIMAPLMMGLAFCAEPLVRIVLTDKWLMCVPFMRIFCITYMFYPIHTANLNAIKAMGRSDLFLKLEIAKKVVGIILLLSSMWFGVMAMAYSLLLSSVLSQIINAWPNKKLLSYGYLDQLKDILPGIMLAVVMGIGISFVDVLPLPSIVVLLIQILCGAVFYIGCSVILKLESFEYLFGMMKTFIEKKRNAS